MQIRVADENDAVWLAQVDRQCFADGWKDRDWKRFLTMPQYCCYIAEHEMKVKGFLLVSSAADEGEIIKIAVLPECRRKKLASAIWKQACEDWKIRGICKLFLEVRETNLPARKFYETSGFEEIGIRKHYYSNPTEHAIVYMKNLS